MVRDPDALHLGREGILERLDASLAMLRWGLTLIPEGWSHRSPSDARVLSREEGAWNVAMNLAHLTLYEERLPATVLGSLLASGDGVTGTPLQEPTPFEPAAVELSAQPLPEILSRMDAAYQHLRDLALQFSEEDWVRPSTRAWGGNGYGPRLHCPARIVAKSAQHVVEHSNPVLRVGLYAPRELLEP